MSTPARPTLPDPRRRVQVGRARVRLGVSLPEGAQPSAWAWQQRMEDALRCARLGEGQRLVLIRKLQVRTGSALAPGWSDVVQAAAQDVVSRACPGRSPGADRADAVWFESWDDAVAAWLDAALGLGQSEPSPHAWYWPRIARMAGLPALLADSSSGGAWPGSGATSARDEQARAMWARWQADPISQRACKAWSAQHPEVLHRWSGRSEAAVISAPTDSASSMQAGDAAPVQDPRLFVPHPQATERPRWDHWDEAVSKASSSDPATHGHAPTARRGVGQDKHGGPKGASRQAASSMADGLDGKVSSHRSPHIESVASSGPGWTEAQGQPLKLDHADQMHAHEDVAGMQPGWVDATELSGQTLRDQPAAAGASQALPPTFGARGWAPLRFTQLGGWPFTIRALQGLGFVQALKALASTQDGLDEQIAASAPWLCLWARLGPTARQHCLRDPMFAALPAFERVEHLPPHAQAPALLACWLDQPVSVRSLGQQSWCKLHRGVRHRGWRSALQLLWRPAWMQLSHTHLDVRFTLDQADLNVRRLGLDADPGWVPWLGRIVSLHFEPAVHLPALPSALPTWSTP